MEKLTATDLREVIEMLAIAITADLPSAIRLRIADRLQELGQIHHAKSANAGTHCIALADLLRSLQGPTNH